MAYENNPMGSGFSDLQDDLMSLKGDLANLRDDLGEILKSALTLGRTRVGDTRERMQDELQSRISKLQGSFDRASEQGRTAKDSVQRQLEDHPVLAIGAAFGLGMLLGSMMQQRK